jgi:hypothetical protein
MLSKLTVLVAALGTVGQSGRSEKAGKGETNEEETKGIHLDQVVGDALQHRALRRLNPDQDVATSIRRRGKGER